MADHGADGVRPDLVPVRCDGRAGSDGRGQLEGAGGTVVIARDLGIGGIGNGVAARSRTSDEHPYETFSKTY